MKRCIICGNVGDDSSTKCDVCGNPFIDTTGKTPEEMQAAENQQDEEAIKAAFAQAVSGSAAASNAAQEELKMPEEAVKEVQQLSEPEGKPADVPEAEAPQAAQDVKEQLVEQEASQMAEQSMGQEAPQSAEQSTGQEVPRTQRRSQGRPVRRMAGAPQIYGQEDNGMARPGQERQGMIRRNVRGVSGQQQQNRPVSPDARRMRPQGQPMNAPQSMNAQGQPVNAPQGMNAQGQPVNAPQGMNVQGQPVNAPQGMNIQGQQSYGQPMRQGNPVQAMGTRPAAPSGNYQARRIQETSRALLKSPVFLLIAILNTACFVGAIAAIFLREMNYSQVVRLIEDTNLPGQVSGYVGSFTSILSMLDSGALLANLALQIPDLLFLIGLWLVFAAAIRSKEEMSSTGFTLVKATVLINMIAACIIMAIVLIVAVAVVVGAWVSGSAPLIIGAVATLIIVIAIVMMVIMYYFCELATIKTCRLNSVAGESYGKVSVYVAVVHIVLALVAIIDLLSGIVNSEMSNIIRAIGKMGWLLLLAVWIFMYRDKMEEVEE